MRKEFERLPEIAEIIKEGVFWDGEIYRRTAICKLTHLYYVRGAWYAWQAKAQAVQEGFVLVEKKNTEDWYLDDCEGMWWDHDGIDGSLCELDIGEVQAVEHKEYLITENNTLYATRVWDDANDQVDCWQFFKTKEEAEKAAAYCKAKFYEEAQEQSK